MKEPINDQTVPPCAHSNISRERKEPFQRRGKNTLSLVSQIRCVEDFKKPEKKPDQYLFQLAYENLLFY